MAILPIVISTPLRIAAAPLTGFRRGFQAVIADVTMAIGVYLIR